MNNKFIFQFTLLLTLFITANIFPQSTPDQIVASVGTNQISIKDFISRCEEYLFSTGVKDNIVVRRAILNNMINEILLSKYDDNKKILSNPEYQKELKWADKQTILAYLEDQEVFAKIKVTDAELREAYYRSNERIAARHLFAQTEEEASNLYQLLQTGADFNSLAKQVFTDSTLQKNGGYLGYFSWGDMDPAFEDAAYSLKIGEISKPVKTKYGYSIIKVEDRVPHPLLTEDEYVKRKHHMEGVVRLRKRNPAERDFINKHFVPNKVMFNEKSLDNVLTNLSYSTANSSEKLKHKSSSTICMKYGNKSYSQNELERRIDEIPAFHREKITSIENLKTVAAGIVLQDILMKMAMEKGYNSVPAVRNLIPKYNNVIFLTYKREEINNNTILPDSIVKRYYDDNPQYFKNDNEMNVQEIIVKRKSLADSLMMQINSGADFGSLAEKYSIREWSAKNKGIMGFSEVSKFGIVKDTLWRSDINKILGPIKIQEVYAIFKVLEKKVGEVKDYEHSKDLAYRLAKKEKSSLVVDEYISKLRKNVNIKVDENMLENAVISN